MSSANPAEVGTTCLDLASGGTFSPSPGQALLDAAHAGGVDLPFGCHVGTCGACAIAVLEGAEHLDPPDAIERDALERYRMAPNERLACRATTRGPLTIRPLDAPIA